MTIAEQTLEILEFLKIREHLARYTSFAASRELALTLLPATEPATVRQRLHLTSEARRLLDEHPQTTIGGARDVREAVRLAGRGGILEASTFLEIGNTLRSIRQLRSLLLKLDAEIYPLLSNLASELPLNTALEDAIERTIDDNGDVLDHASPQLGRLRRQIRVAGSRLQERLHAMVASGQYASVLQEALVTVRDGRYVLPVKADKRRALPGLVHDQSASGATLYIEPMAVVELNNEWREAQLAEQQEVQRVLAALSQQVGGAAEELVAGVETLALLDLALAQAKYAQALRCVAPRIIDGRQPAPIPSAEDALSDRSEPLLLTAARHPLLNQETVVPIDVWLGSDFRLLLITGPNTGGKTVALKTVGLLALMAQAGLHIPAREPSRLPVFTQVFADIGDEQSIEQSLSTFSSHMTNIIRILGAIDNPATSADWERRQPDTTPLPDTLVLLDELGAGTDPVEGAALARAISERLLDRGCLAICTTHYAELKAFAHNTPGIQNASVEFDVETLAPTYRLTIGLPGRSNALAIASRLGLAPDLIEAARSTITGEEVQIEHLLSTIRAERETAAAERQRAEELRADAEKYRERHAEALRELETSLQEQVDEANRALEHELRAVRGEMRRLRDESRSASVSRQWAQEAEQRIQELRAQAEVTGKNILAPFAQSTDTTATGEQAPRPLRVGDPVQVRSLGLNGEILAIDEEDETAEVQVGGFRVEVELNELRREKDGKSRDTAESPTSRPAASTKSLPPMPEVSMDFDMRGWRAAEVPDKLDRYLNDAYLAGLPSVRIIHGKGSGTLRQVVRDMLGQHRLVKSFGGGGADGGEGVTVAQLTER